MRFSLLSIILRDGTTMTPAELESYVSAHYGPPIDMSRMVVRDTKTAEEVECWASWSGWQRKAGMEFTIKTVAGTPAHRFMVPGMQLTPVPWG